MSIPSRPGIPTKRELLKGPNGAILVGARHGIREPGILAIIAIVIAIAIAIAIAISIYPLSNSDNDCDEDEVQALEYLQNGLSRSGI